ncbi:uncharacterized protein B0H64DRAFT_399515 [Chaetomium fimeti]|uniref:Secreted protein n=1 Tax=Chaetomium fimeti TaxID=1854472 RepID=A0AAE0HCI0_9PEZI|nr:hypothetical protein B0H64DRAFT_399515 [Chaetomium fimeti]
MGRCGEELCLFGCFFLGSVSLSLTTTDIIRSERDGHLCAITAFTPSAASTGMVFGWRIQFYHGGMNVYWIM